MKNTTLQWVWSMVLLLPLTLLAQSADLPGNTQLPSSREELEKLAQFDNGNYLYSVEDYFMKPDKGSAQISPDGRYLSYKLRQDNGISSIVLQDNKTGKVTPAIEEKENLIAKYLWVSSTVILYVQDNKGDENYHLYAYDIENGRHADLTPFENIKVRNLYYFKELKDAVIITMNYRNKEVFEPYKVNFKTGKLDLIFENTDLEHSISDFYFTKKGTLKAYAKQKNGIENVLYYKSNTAAAFQEVLTISWKDTFEIIDFVKEDSDLAYVLSNLENDKDEILIYDLKAGKTIKKLFRNEIYDLGSISLSSKRKGQLDYYYFEASKRTIVPISGTYKKLHSKVKKKIGNDFFEIISQTDKEDQLVINVYSDVNPGREYVYDVKKDQLTLISDLKPKLNPDTMSKMIPIQFTARDGLPLHGYLTIPHNSTGKVPLIVNPHGGPYGVRDVWGFNPEVQLFASRGIATLQINYRGSGGYGKTHYLAGSKQIGRKMLEDLEDGVHYVVESGQIDETKIAVYGASYGGLAALGSLIKSPEIYKCGISYCGVSNFFTFVDSFPKYWKPLMKQFYDQWYDPEVPEEKEIMKKSSPALNIEKLNKPLFIIQGANDPRVHINESDQIVKAVREKGFDVPYMVKYDEGHGFDREDNRIELYKAIVGFFAKNLN